MTSRPCEGNPCKYPAERLLKQLWYCQAWVRLPLAQESACSMQGRQCVCDLVHALKHRRMESSVLQLYLDCYYLQTDSVALAQV